MIARGVGRLVRVGRGGRYCGYKASGLGRVEGEDREEENIGASPESVRLNRLIEEVRAGTQPFESEVSEPNVPLDEYKKIQDLQRIFREQLSLGKTLQAKDTAEKLVDMGLKYYPRGHPVMLSACNNLAIILKRNGQFQEAKALLVTVYEGYCTLLGQTHAHSIVTLTNLASVYKLNLEFDQALKIYKEVLALREKQDPLQPREILQVKAQIAACQRDLNNSQESMKILAECIEEAKRLHNDPEDLMVANLQVSKGLAAKKLKKYDLAESLYKSALAIREAHYPANHPEVLAICHNLASLYQELGRETEATEYSQRVLHGLKEDQH